VALADRLAKWPLLLDLANGVVRARIARGASPADALAYTERAIAQRGIATAFQSDDHESRRRTAWGTLEISLEQAHQPVPRHRLAGEFVPFDGGVFHSRRRFGPAECDSPVLRRSLARYRLPFRGRAISQRNGGRDGDQSGGKQREADVHHVQPASCWLAVR
jgi:hypothetical protein